MKEKSAPLIPEGLAVRSSNYAGGALFFVRSAYLSLKKKLL